MKILFLTLLDFSSFSERNIYCDLLREFIRNGHDVYCISPVERRFGKKTHLEENGHLLKLKIGNTQKTNLIEKGISTLLIEPQFKAAVKHFFAYVKFDLILYSTPPITLVSTIEYVKKRDNAKTYLMLKDIFPQNAVDLDILRRTGVKGILYRYFRKKEEKLYSVSNKIGCMSQANVDYVLKHNPKVKTEKVEVCPNSVEVQDMRLSDDEKINMRKKYGIPEDKKVFVYGGNLGKPQGIPFIIDCLRIEKDNDRVFFLIVGEGTEYDKLAAFVMQEKPANVKLIKLLPKEDYDRLVAACDIGLVFLDHRFTIPNFPSRLLSYMQAGIPVLACTDSSTDIGQVITEAGFGWWCESEDAKEFSKNVDTIIYSDCSEAGALGMKYLSDNYSVDEAYRTIMNAMKR